MLVTLITPTEHGTPSQVLPLPFFFFSYARQEICISRPIDYAAQCWNPHHAKHQSTMYKEKLYKYYYIVNINTVVGGM